MKTFSLLFVLVFIVKAVGLCQQTSYSLPLKEIQIHKLRMEGSRNIFSLEKDGCATLRVQGIGVSVLIRVHDPNGHLMREYSQWAYDGPLPMNVQV